MCVNWVQVHSASHTTGQWIRETRCWGFNRGASRLRRQWHPTPVLLPGKSHGWRTGRLQSMGLLRVGQDWATSLSLFTFMHWRRKWQPTPCSCLENPRDGGAWWAAVYGVAKSWTRLKWLSSSSSRLEGPCLRQILLRGLHPGKYLVAHKS